MQSHSSTVSCLSYPLSSFVLFNINIVLKWSSFGIFSHPQSSHSPSIHSSCPLIHFFLPSLCSCPASCCRSYIILHNFTCLLSCPLFAWLNTSLPLKSLLCPLSSLLTVIQDVDSSSLEANYQSFANLMEQRLAELFLVAGRQGPQTARSRRATTVGSYTVQVGGNGFYFLSLCVLPVLVMAGLCLYLYIYLLYSKRTSCDHIFANKIILTVFTSASLWYGPRLLESAALLRLYLQ